MGRCHPMYLAVAVVVVTLLIGCGDTDVVTGPSASSAPSAGAGPTPDSVADRVGPDASSSTPPPVQVTGAGSTLELNAWTYCFASVCVDGSPPDDPPDVGATDEVEVEFPLEDWTFEATFVPVGQECPRHITVPTVRQANGSLLLAQAGHPGTYDVTLFGRGNGDVLVTFRWTTTGEGTLPEPVARLAVLADNDGVVDSYGVELVLSDLAATPTVAEASITVRSSEGREHRFTPTPMANCASEGVIAWNGPGDDGQAAAGLGTGPFTYEVGVVLDGVVHRARAVWPTEQIIGNEPSVSLTFEPPLPAME